MVDQFDRLMKRKAFLDQYKKEKWFADGLGEFDEARYVFSIMFFFSCLTTTLLHCRQTVQELIDEYKACESPDYISYVSSLLHRQDMCINFCVYP